jgi:cell volume regulation protein A
VGGVPVVEHLRTRRDQPGALVALEDGRFAITGATVAIGSPQQLQAYGRRRLRVPCPEAEQAWWQEVIGAVART